MMEGNTGIDHIHILVSIPPKYSVATIAGYLKKNFKGHNFWARGYYVSTVGLDEIFPRLLFSISRLRQAFSMDNDAS